MPIYILTSLHTHITTYPPAYLRAPSQGCPRQQSQGFGATILVRVLVFGGYRHRDVKPPVVAGIGILWCHVSPDFRKFSTCAATSHLEHGISSWHDIVLYMIIFFLHRGRLHYTTRTKTEPTTQTTVGRRRRVLMQCSASAPEHVGYGDYNRVSKGY